MLGVRRVATPVAGEKAAEGLVSLPLPKSKPTEFTSVHDPLVRVGSHELLPQGRQLGVPRPHLKVVANLVEGAQQWQGGLTFVSAASGFNTSALSRLGLEVHPQVGAFKGDRQLPEAVRRQVCTWAGRFAVSHAGAPRPFSVTNPAPEPLTPQKSWHPASAAAPATCNTVCRYCVATLSPMPLATFL